MRVSVVVVLLLAAACGDDGPAADGSTGDGSTSTNTSPTASAPSSTSEADTSSSSSTAAESSSGGPDEPPRDEDFEWEIVEPLDCGDRGHVVLDSGPSANRISLVILGDGYTAEEVGTAYVEHVDAFLLAMFGPDGFPYDVYTRSFDICRIDVVSNGSGIDFADQGIEVDTALNGRGDVSTRLAYVDVSLVEAQLEDALATSNVEADWVAVTLNTELWVGAGGYPMLWSGGHDVPEIGVHEAGHTFHGLADEYSEGNGAYDGGEPGEINVTADLRSDKWAVWLGFDQHDLGEIGFYEGAKYFDTGMWRPSFAGRMREVTRSHNAPSIDKMIRDFYMIARPIDDFSPKVENEYPPALGLRVIDEALVTVDWEVDGEVALADAGPRIWTAELGLTPGGHEVTAVVRDPTEWVRSEDRSMLEMRVTWPLQVPANLEPTLGLHHGAPRSEPPRWHPRATTRIVTAQGRPHALPPEHRRTLAANAELLRIHDALLAGHHERAGERLHQHAITYPDLHDRDRQVLAAAIACLDGMPSQVRARGRFAKTLRRACR